MKYTDEEVRKAVSIAKNYKDCLRILGLPQCGKTTKRLREFITYRKIDTSSFEKRNTVLSIGKTRPRAVLLRNALSKIGREYKCSECDISEWRGQKITIEIHHINGNDIDNREENLQYLCPNCHSLTENFRVRNITNSKCECGKNKSIKADKCFKCSGVSKRSQKPEKLILEKLIWEKPISHISKELKVSDKTVSSWCESYSIIKPPSGYWQKNKKNITLQVRGDLT